MLPKTVLAAILMASMVSAGDFHGPHALAGNRLASMANLAVRQNDETSESGAPPAAAQTSAAPTPSDDKDGDKPAETSAPPPPATSAPPAPTTSAEEQKPTEEPTTPPPQTSAAPEPTTAPTTPPAQTTPPAETSQAPQPSEEKPEEQSTVTRKETSQAAIITAAPETPKESKTSAKAEPTTLYESVEYTTVVVTRNPAGVEETSTKVEKSLRPTATAAPIDSQPKTESGMSKQTKTTVIGVVCGVGGAILLAAVFFLWWKWSSRRKQRAAIDDGDELVGMNAFQPSGMGSTSEKHGGMGGGGQGGLFKDNLESYHAPVNQRPANAGTNF